MAKRWGGEFALVPVRQALKAVFVVLGNQGIHLVILFFLLIWHDFMVKDGVAMFPEVGYKSPGGLDHASDEAPS